MNVMKLDIPGSGDEEIMAISVPEGEALSDDLTRAIGGPPITINGREYLVVSARIVDDGKVLRSIFTVREW